MGCTPVASSNWYSWLATELKKRPGVECVLHDFPDPYKCRESIWIPHVEKLMAGGDGGGGDGSCCEGDVVAAAAAHTTTLLVGHSSGAACAMRLLEKAAATKTPVAGCILVAAAHTDLGDEDERLSEYFNRPWNWESMVQGVTKKIVLFHGTDDHLIPIQEARYIAEQLEFSDKFVFYEMSGKSHFFRPWPELLTAVDDILKQC